MGFITINIVINFILFLSNRNRMHLKLFVYWLLILPIFFAQGYFANNQFSIILAFSLFCIPTTILTSVGFDLVGEKFPLKRYIGLYIIALILTLILQSAGLSFMIVAMPLSLSVCIPFLHAALYILVLRRFRSTPLQKFLGFIFLPSAIHGINFALFRMDPGSQLWGWLISYALYDILAILLPSIALEEANSLKNSKLTTLVEERTSELGISNLKLQQLSRTNESLLKVVLHDIAGPIMVSRMLLSRLKVDEAQENHLHHINKSFSIIEDILKQIKTIHETRSESITLPLAEVEVDECMKDLMFIFEENISKKNIKLNYENKMSPNSKILVEKTSFTHSVLGNLLSNSIKFSPESSQIDILAEAKNDKVIIEISDRGIGMGQDYIQNFMNGARILSTPGTNEETGTGFGLFIVKSFVDLYGGGIEIQSQEKSPNYENHGTRIKLTLNRA